MAASVGYKMVLKTSDSIHLQINGSILKKFKILEKFEFSSDRKRMSVIVEDENSQIWSFIKGADSIVLSLLELG